MSTEQVDDLAENWISNFYTHSRLNHSTEFAWTGLALDVENNRLLDGLSVLKIVFGQQNQRISAQSARKMKLSMYFQRSNGLAVQMASTFLQKSSLLAYHCSLFRQNPQPTKPAPPLGLPSEEGVWTPRRIK